MTLHLFVFGRIESEVSLGEGVLAGFHSLRLKVNLCITLVSRVVVFENYLRSRNAEHIVVGGKSIPVSEEKREGVSAELEGEGFAVFY